MVLMLLAVLAAAPLDEARAHLSAGRLDDVLFALDGKSFTAADKPKAAALLGEASLTAFQKKDDLLALQFVQMALKLQPAQPLALEAAARASFRQQQFESAEGYADAWLRAEPRRGAARLLRAELADAAGEWALVLDHLSQAQLEGADAARAKTLRATAEKELTEAQASRSAVKSLEERLAEAARRPLRVEADTAPRGGGEVVLYGTSWCGFCRKAKAFLKQKGVSFVERDVERDAGAAEELARKAVAAGVQPRGVPVIDVRGTLVLGFDRAALERALEQ